MLPIGLKVWLVLSIEQSLSLWGQVCLWISSEYILNCGIICKKFLNILIFTIETLSEGLVNKG
jgi:hypothetical protein